MKYKISNCYKDLNNNLLGLSTSSQTGLLLGLGLWLVLHGKLEEGGSGLLVQALEEGVNNQLIKSDFYLAELVDHWWDLETLLENGALTLDADILGPLDEAGQVTLWLDITTLKVGLLLM